MKKNLLKLLERFKDEKGVLRVALIEYRDKGDVFVTRKVADLTQNLDEIGTAVEKLEVSGGDDYPEAVLDAIYTAATNLSWDTNTNSKRVALLIGDAPPHPKTIDGAHDANDISSACNNENIKIAIYPIIT